MSPIYLEAAVVILGLFLLLLETFADGLNKKDIAWLGVLGLCTVFVLTFFVNQVAPTASVPSYQIFYSTDDLAMFFKRFALLTTIVVLVLRLDAVIPWLQGVKANLSALPVGRVQNVLAPGSQDNLSLDAVAA